MRYFYLLRFSVFDISSVNQNSGKILILYTDILICLIHFPALHLKTSKPCPSLDGDCKVLKPNVVHSHPFRENTKPQKQPVTCAEKNFLFYSTEKVDGLKFYVNVRY